MESITYKSLVNDFCSHFWNPAINLFRTVISFARAANCSVILPNYDLIFSSTNHTQQRNIRYNYQIFIIVILYVWLILRDFDLTELELYCVCLIWIKFSIFSYIHIVLCLLLILPYFREIMTRIHKFYVFGKLICCNIVRLFNFWSSIWV